MKSTTNSKNNKRKTIEVFSKKLKKKIKVDLNPQNLPQELYECVGMSNEDYGS